MPNFKVVRGGSMEAALEAARDPADCRTGAGLVVWRPGSSGIPEYLLVHRPKYDDWSLPKGKTGSADTGFPEVTALREVWEETGMRCMIEAQLGPVFYNNHSSQRRMDHYWLARPLHMCFQPHDRREVDRCRWVTIDQALTLDTYAHDRDVLLRANKVVLRVLEQQAKPAARVRMAAGRTMDARRRVSARVIGA